MQYSQVYQLESNDYLTYLHTQIRDKNADLACFEYYSNQLLRQLLVKAATLLPYDSEDVITPIGETYQGLRFSRGVCGVSVIRAGESFEGEYRKIFSGQPVGKILIQRNPQTKLPHYFYSHFPDDIAERSVLLFEPMLATGGSLVMAIETLLENQVSLKNIYVVNVLASPAGIERLYSRFPDIVLVTSSIEQGLSDQAFMKPGIGDFGDRYFGTRHA
ncbi:uracil phosphoribosyltransferase [Pectobacterium aroidearum]|uniref:uracil phosphoribosyltransferase n=1 Tax=Pectobacterium aroidearum TaxID=1201031 RepID=UPI0015F00E02|nr:uracil phosphoribosyltransferase [Pectobacterium aroidearum]MBA5234958.1 uracil phosphoribosyltransferase [Pectobacterium aroidearum]